MFVSNAINPSRRRCLLPRARLAAIAVGGALALSTAFLTAGSASAFASTGGPSFNFGNNTSTVYTETNQTAGNAVIVYSAAPGGGLTQIASVSRPGGTGTGTSPGSQGGVTLGDNGRLLVVVWVRTALASSRSASAVSSGSSTPLVRAASTRSA